MHLIYTQTAAQPPCARCTNTCVGKPKLRAPRAASIAASIAS